MEINYNILRLIKILWEMYLLFRSFGFAAINWRILPDLFGSSFSVETMSLFIFQLFPINPLNFLIDFFALLIYVFNNYTSSSREDFAILPKWLFQILQKFIVICSFNWNFWVGSQVNRAFITAILRFWVICKLFS